jgi:hypothetical protein
LNELDKVHAQSFIFLNLCYLEQLKSNEAKLDIIKWLHDRFYFEKSLLFLKPIVMIDQVILILDKLLPNLERVSEL